VREFAAMTTNGPPVDSSPAANPGADAVARPALPGFAITALTPDEATSVTAAMLIVMLAAGGENVAAMVPVETGIDDPCEAGSHGALIRWAAGHLDDPRQVTPFALEAKRSAMHAADASGTLLHGAAFELARESLSDGRTTMIVLDAIGPLDPITPSLTMLDLLARWALPAIIVEPLSRATVGHVRLVALAMLSRDIPVAGVVLTPFPVSDDDQDGAAEAIRETLAAMLGCPVVIRSPVMLLHDRSILLDAARQSELHRVMPRRTVT